MNKPFPWSFAVNDRPVKIIDVRDGNGGARVFDWTQASHAQRTRNHAQLRTVALALLAIAVGACSVHDPLFCDETHPCTDPSRPYCDIEGAYPASERIGKTCIPSPFDASSCVPAACPLGCSADMTHCLQFDPSNGLGPALASARDKAELTLQDGAKIDTDSGTVIDGGGSQVAIASEIVTQADGPSIRVFEVKSLHVGSVRATGTNALAFVSDGDVVITGAVDVSAHGTTRGPGAFDCSPAGGHGGDVTLSANQTSAQGAGGGGFGTDGARGGINGLLSGGAGGAHNGTDALAPLRGGCDGGYYADATTGMHVLEGGAGGGALQIVSNTSITVRSDGSTLDGAISAGGGGGPGSPISGPNGGAGGGAGGGILLEAPKVLVTGNGAALVANGGGGGGGCGNGGADGRLDVMSAAGGVCAGGRTSSGGGGAAGTQVAQPGGDFVATTDPGRSGGGGGGLGRIRVNAANAIVLEAGAIASPAISLGSLHTH